MFGIKDCIQKLEERLDEQNKQTIMLTPRDELIKYHYGLGRWIRNECNLWKDGTEQIEKEIYNLMEKDIYVPGVTKLMERKMRNEYEGCDYSLSHPDNVSNIIIEIYHDYLNGNFDLELL